jgi:hypothetical protein
MKNADTSAFFLPETEQHYGQAGLTKREKFCLQMGVPKTGDSELDEIISEGNRIKLTGLAMQGLLASTLCTASCTPQFWMKDTIESSVEFADALLAEIDK